MNIDFELYRIFNEVATIGNITLAAERLHISQPAVSKAIKSLEEQLGGKLFVRTKKGVTKTCEGEELHKYISSAIDFIRNGENRFTNMINLEYGVIKMTVSKTIMQNYLLPYLKKFHEMYPNIKIEIDTSITSDAIHKLRDGLIDFIITNLPVAEHLDIECTKLMDIQDVFVVSPTFPIDKYEINLNELNNYPLILQPKGNTTRDYLDAVLDKHNIYLEPEMTLSSYSLVSDMTRIGYGVGYLVENYIQGYLKNKELIKIKTNPSIPPRHIGLLTKKNTVPSFADAEFINLLTKKDK